MASWRTISLGEVSQNHDARRVPVREADRKSGPYPYYGASGVVDHVDSYLFEGLHLLVAEDGENLRTRKLPIAFLANDKFWVNNHAHILTGNHLSDTRFLCYALSIADVASYLSGSTMPKLTQGNLARIPIRLPDLAEQRHIVGLLGALDEKIELNRRMNETLEASARALFRDWFVDFGPTRAKAEGRPAYLAPDLWSLFPDCLGDDGVPKGWEWSTIGEEVEAVGGSTPSTKNAAFWDGGISWTTPKDLSDLGSPILLNTARTITEAGLCTISSGLLPAGTVLMSSRAPVGYLAIASVPLAVNQGYIAMKCMGRISNWGAYIWAHENMDAIISNANGSTFQEISKRNFRPLPILVAEEVTRSAFDRLVGPMFARITANVIESRTLAATRDALLPKLMSGELRVRDAEALAA